MIKANDFVSACTSRGYSFFTGVPCTFLKPLINYVIQNPDLDYIAASSEGEAVGIAAGAHLAGRGAVVMCQNSGLGNAVNPLTSLNFPFRIPLLLIVSLRGEPGLKDEPEHELMGQITGELLDTIRIKWDFFPNVPEMIEKVLDRAQEEMTAIGLPYALVMKKGSVAETGLLTDEPFISSREQVLPQGQFRCKLGERMTRTEAIQLVREEISDEDAVVASTGKIGRELFTIGDRENQLYVVGSMGCASGLGFGIQYLKPKQRVIVLDGDGAALMKMGTLATIGHYQPSKFIHIILDNEAHDSTGGQYTVSSSVDFCTVAAACGYQQCYRADKKPDVISAVNSSKSLPGPSLIHVKVAPGSDPQLGRPTVQPVQVKERFMRFLQTGNAGI